jgi:hypothetical protein
LSPDEEEFAFDGLDHIEPSIEEAARYLRDIPEASILTVPGR